MLDYNVVPMRRNTTTDQREYLLCKEEDDFFVK